MSEEAAKSRTGEATTMLALKATLLPALGLLLGAVVVGLVYNSVSPLGVRTETGTFGPLVIPPPVSTATTSNSSPVAIVPSVQTTQTESTVTSSEPLPTVISAPSAPSVDEGQEDIPKLTWLEVKPLLLSGQIVLVDARSNAHYKAGHIPGAVSLQYGSTSSAMSEFMMEYPPTSHLVVYCGSASCPMGRKLAEKLFVEYGYFDINVMPGGYAEFRQATARGVQK